MLKKPKSPINVLEHSLVPEMKIVAPGHVKSILEEYDLSDSGQLPKMKKSDPAAAALGAKDGDVLKIDRVEPTGKCTYYRLVVE